MTYLKLNKHKKNYSCEKKNIKKLSLYFYQT